MVMSRALKKLMNAFFLSSPIENVILFYISRVMFNLSRSCKIMGISNKTEKSIFITDSRIMQVKHIASAIPN